MKDFPISWYIKLFGMIFSVFKIIPLRKKTVFLSSFGNNALFIANELAKTDDHLMVFLNDRRCRIDFSKAAPARKKIYFFETKNVWHMLMSIYHLATASHVFVDNYVGVFSGIRFRRGVKPVQMWHAAGAIKRFGWTDPETSLRSKTAQARFQAVYDQFNYIPVGSRKMADIFAKSFNLNKTHFLQTGVPMTDFYFDTDAKSLAVENVLRRFPEARDKKIILYAPTFRKDQLDHQPLQLNVTELLSALPNAYVIMVRLHPAVRNTTILPDHKRLIDVGEYSKVNELLATTDILVTDYSSLPFEFALLRRKMIFFLYDLAEYKKQTGTWAESLDFFPGPTVMNTTELINHIVDPDINYQQIDNFNMLWNEFSDGRSSRKLIDKIYHKSNQA